MAFERKLEWRQHPEVYDLVQKKILLGLSSRKWLWRTFDSLQKVTRLPADDLGFSLDELINWGLVKGSVNHRTREPIFGLTERVGGPNPIQQQRHK